MTTSWWQDQTARADIALTPQLLLKPRYGANSIYDLSPFVRSWPAVSRKLNSWGKESASVELVLEGMPSGVRDVLRYQEGQSALLQDEPYAAQVSLGLLFTHPASRVVGGLDGFGETQTLFEGGIAGLSWSRGVVALKLETPISRLSKCEAVSGTIIQLETPGKVVWYLVTCGDYGGPLDDTAGDSNSEINYEYLSSWDNSFLQSNWGATIDSAIEGEATFANIIDMICKVTHSVAGVDDQNRLLLTRRNGYAKEWGVFTERDIIKAKYANRYWEKRPSRLFMEYWSGIEYQKTVIDNARRTLRYGYVERDWSSPVIRARSSTIARRILQQVTGGEGIVFADGNTYHSAEVTVGLRGVVAGVGDAIRLTDSWHNVTSETRWTVMGRRVDLQRGTVSFDLEERYDKITQYS